MHLNTWENKLRTSRKPGKGNAFKETFHNSHQLPRVYGSARRSTISSQPSVGLQGYRDITAAHKHNNLRSNINDLPSHFNPVIRIIECTRSLYSVICKYRIIQYYSKLQLQLLYIKRVSCWPYGLQPVYPLQLSPSFTFINFSFLTVPHSSYFRCTHYCSSMYSY